MLWGTDCRRTVATYSGRVAQFVESCRRARPIVPPTLPLPSPAGPPPVTLPAPVAREDFEALRADLAKLQAALASLKGPKGDPGPPGKDATIDYDKLAAEVARRLPPIKFQTIDPSGNTVHDIDRRLGDTVRFRIYPVPGARTPHGR